MKTVTVRDLGYVVTGHTPPTKKREYYGDFYPFVKPTDMIIGNKYTYHTEEGYSKLAYEKYNTSLIPKGSTCVVCIGTLGEKMTMAHCDLFTNQSVNSIIPNDEYDNHYVYYLLKYNLGKVKALNKGTASGREFVSKTTFLDMMILVHEDKKTQHKIGQILSAYDELIENNQKQIKLLEEAAQRLYKEWFVDLRFPGHETTPIIDGIPEGWSKERLVNIADVQYGFAFDGSLFNSEGNGMPIIRIRNIPDGITKDYTTEEANKQYIVNNGDIVVGMDGEFHINSWCGSDAYLVQRTCCIKPKKPEMKGYLLQAIYEPIKFFEKTVVGATVAHLGKKHIDTIMILNAPEEFYKPFQLCFEKRQILLNQNQLLSEARDRLLPKLMRGELEV